MKPVKFAESNMVFGAGQSEYKELPALATEDGQIITFWKMSLVERLRVLFSRGVWLSMITFNRGVSPVYMTTKKSDLIDESEGVVLSELERELQTFNKQ